MPRVNKYLGAKTMIRSYLSPTALSLPFLSTGSSSVCISCLSYKMEPHLLRSNQRLLLLTLAIVFISSFSDTPGCALCIPSTHTLSTQTLTSPRRASITRLRAQQTYILWCITAGVREPSSNHSVMSRASGYTIALWASGRLAAHLPCLCLSSPSRFDTHCLGAYSIAAHPWSTLTKLHKGINGSSSHTYFSYWLFSA